MTEDLITLNLPHDNLTSFVQLFYAIGLVCTYPLQVLPAFDLLEKMEWFLMIPNFLFVNVRRLRLLPLSLV